MNQAVPILLLLNIYIFVFYIYTYMQYNEILRIYIVNRTQTEADAYRKVWRRQPMRHETKRQMS